MRKKKKTTFPVLPLRDIVIFPHMIVPIFVGRTASINALEAVMKQRKKEILLVLQNNQTTEEPKEGDMCSVGVIGTLLQLLRLPDGTIKLLVQGRERMQISSFDTSGDFITATAEPAIETLQYDENLEGLINVCLESFESFTKTNRKVPSEILEGISQMDDPSKLADTIASYFTLQLSEKQELLATVNVNERLQKVLSYIENEATVLDLEKSIRSRVKTQMEKTQRDYYLNEQIKAINKELGEGNEAREDLQEIEEKRKNASLSKEASEKVDSELKKLRLMHPSSAEAAIVRNYVD
jgi:ATP-dependent Lon protease